jgi:WG containing repeat
MFKIILYTLLLLFYQPCLSQSNSTNYDYVSDYVNGKGMACKKGKCGVINKQGATLIPFQYDYLTIGTLAVLASKESNQVFLDFNGNNILNDQFSFAALENDSIAIVMKMEERNYFIVNLKTKKLSPVNNCRNLIHIKDGYFKVNFGQDEHFYLLNQYGEKTVSDSFKQIGPGYKNGFRIETKTGIVKTIKADGSIINLPNNLADAYPLSAIPNLFIIKNKENKYGVADAALKSVTPVIYDYAGYSEIPDILLVIQKDNYGLIDTKGKIILPCTSPNKPTDYNGNYIVTESKDYKKTIIDKKNNSIIPAANQFIHLKSKTALIGNTGSYRILNLETKKWEGNNIVYNDIQVIQENYYLLKRDGKWGVKDENTKILVPFIYDSLRSRVFKMNGVNAFSARKDGKYGVIDISNKTLLPFDYTTMEQLFTFGTMWVLKNNKYGAINTKNEVVIPFEYDSYVPHYTGQVLVRKGDKRGIIDNGGNIIIPIIYENVKRYSHNGLAAIRKDKKWGFVNRQLELVIPFQYDTAEMFSYNKASVTLNGKSFYIDEKGNKIIK